MRKLGAITMVLSILFLSAAAFAEGESRFSPNGPLTYRNLMPLYEVFLAMPPERPEVTRNGKFDFGLNYHLTNVIVDQWTTPDPTSYKDYFTIDAEINRLGFDMRYGAWDNLDVNLEIPFVSFSGGSLDSFIEDFEDTFGFNTPHGRQRRAKNKYTYNLRLNSRNIINTTEPASGLGDINLGFKYKLLNEGTYYPAMALRSMVKFPTADNDKFLGSGKFDYGVGLALEKSYKRLFIYVNANGIFIEKPGFFGDIATEDHMVTGSFALEYFVIDSLSLIGQITANTSAFKNIGLRVVDDHSWDGMIGFNYNFKKNMSWQGAVVENGEASSSPDVSFITSFKFKL